MPLVNPGGMYLMRRANVNGVDLMRNAPVHADKMSLRLRSLEGIAFLSTFLGTAGQRVRPYGGRSADALRFCC